LQSVETIELHRQSATVLRMACNMPQGAVYRGRYNDAGNVPAQGGAVLSGAGGGEAATGAPAAAASGAATHDQPTNEEARPFGGAPIEHPSG
jgi:hypothetical protein